MKRRVILSLICSVFCFPIFAQTIHWIIFADTQDSSNGTEIQNSVSSLTTQFIDRMNDAIIPKGYSPKQRIYSGSGFTESNCNQVIKNLSCSQEDVIVFYYLGHGGRAEVGNDASAYARTHPWPDLQFESANMSKQKEFLSLQSIHNKLKQKKARFTLTIGMCCNKELSQYKKHGASYQSSKYKLVSKRFAKKIGQRLFLRYKGDVLVASAQPGQFSYGGTYNGKDVDCFTAALCEILDTYANNDTGDNVTWDSFLNEVFARCTDNARMDGEQKPKKIVNVVQAK